MESNFTSPWLRVEAGQWLPVTAQKTPLSVKKNSFLFHQEGDSGQLYIVKAGRIRITTFQRDGSEKQLYIAEVGSLFGERSCMLGTRHATSAVAIVDSLVYIIPFTEAQAAMAENPALGAAFMRLVCRKNSILMKQVVELSFSDSLQRIAQALVNLAGAYGQETEEGVCVPIRFTHQDVANLTNTSRVTVSNAFNLLTSKGILFKKEGKTILADLEALRAMADGSY